MKVATFRFPPQTFRGWVLFLAGAAFVAIFLVVFAVVFLAVAGLSLIAAPFRGRRPPEPPGVGDGPGSGRILDVDAEISPPRPPE